MSDMNDMTDESKEIIFPSRYTNVKFYYCKDNRSSLYAFLPFLFLRKFLVFYFPFLKNESGALMADMTFFKASPLSFLLPP